MTIARQFFLLFFLTFVLTAGFVIRRTYQFARISTEGARLTDNLQQTITLNQALRQGINNQISLLLHQVERPDPLFLEKFNTLNFALGDKHTQYLKLDISEEERLAIDNIKTVHSELAVQSIQIFEQLRMGHRGVVLGRLNELDLLANRVGQGFDALHGIQIRKLQAMLNRLNESIAQGYFATSGLIGGLVLVLGVFTFLLRKRVLQPVRSILEASDQIRLGDFSARAPASRADEIGRLAHGFNFMAGSLAESYAGLERKVEERTAQLAALQQQLVQSEKMSAVGQLVSGVAHELNNPLATIIGFTELAKMDLVAGKGDSKAIQLMEDINFQADRCRRIVTNLLQFARWQEPRLETIRINEVVQQALQLREYELESRNVSLVREFDPADPIVSADPHKMQQVMLNLLNNAHDAIQESGSKGTIWVRTRAEGENVTIEFLDNGTGIRDPAKVFDPFYTTKEVGKGTGLGLSICYGIVQEHRGEIRAENWEKGARFIITLPKAEWKPVLEEPKAIPMPTLHEPVRQTREALVVDDEEGLLRLQTLFLSKIGMHAITAATGEDAIRCLQEQTVSIVISDVRMPGSVDGLQLYEWVIKHKPELQKRFLFVSGDMVGLNLETLFQNSPVASIQKPFTFKEYSSKVKQVLEESGVP
jgi:two-component system NtrC family sensor kinase